MKASQRHQVWRGGAPGVDDLAEEAPVAFEYNGISHAVMLATPGDLEDFAVGFSLSEGIVEKQQDIFDIVVVESAAGIALQMDIGGRDFARLKERRRSLAGRTGCGLCGTESLEHVPRRLAPLPPTAPLPMAALYSGMHRLPEMQALQKMTGATHAACCVERNGTISYVREDVGRHNALDKTLGALVRDGSRVHGSAVIITSRASYEMVQKAATLGVGTLAAVSAPTAAAVRLAEELRLKLFGFVREGTCVAYSGSANMKEFQG